MSLYKIEFKTQMFQFQNYGAGVQACYPCILLILTHFKGLRQNNSFDAAP